MKRIQITTVALVAAAMAHDAGADVFSEAAELGANTGAVAYCGDRFADDDDDGRYKILRIKLLEEFEALPDDQKAKALVLKKAAEDDGEYLGKRLDEDRCTSLRKLLYLKY